MTRLFTSLCTALAIAAAVHAPAAAAQTKDNPYLVSVGALAAAQLFTTASYLDVTKEALVRDAFKAKDVRIALERMSGMTDNVGRYLTDVIQTNITDEDRAFLQEAVAVYGLLKTESLSLHRYAGTRAASDLDAFVKAREVAWERLRKLLKLPA